MLCGDLKGKEIQKRGEIYIYTHTHTHTHTYIYVTLYVILYIYICMTLYVIIYICDCFIVEINNIVKQLYSIKKIFKRQACLTSNFIQIN